jgi:hypothetical protein
MGQQQLLLLVLGSIIVGLSIVVGINLFRQGALKANEDAVRQDLLTMMSRAEEFYRKPVLLGGGGKSFSELGSFTNLGYRYNSDGGQVWGTEYSNDNGTYTLTAGDSPQIKGALAEDPTLTVTYAINVDATTNQTSITELSESSSDGDAGDSGDSGDSGNSGNNGNGNSGNNGNGNSGNNGNGNSGNNGNGNSGNNGNGNSGNSGNGNSGNNGNGNGRGSGRGKG